MGKDVTNKMEGVFCLCAVIVSAAGWGVAAPVVPDLAVRREADPVYLGNDVYSAQGVGQSRVMQVGAGERARCYVQVGNDGATKSAIQVGISAAEPGWTQKFYAAVRALSFDGQNDGVSLGTWSPGATWTAEAWVKPSASLPGRHTILGGGSACVAWGIAMQDGKFGAVYPSESTCNEVLMAEASAAVEQWQHVAATCDGAKVRLYVEGELQGEADCEGGAAPAGEVWMGLEGCCEGNNFAGSIRNVRVWNRALGLAELRRETVTTNEAGLLGYWRLEEMNGNTALDSSTYLRHGTLTNGPVWVANLTEEDRVDITAQAGASAGYPVNLAPQETVELMVEWMAPASAVGSTNRITVSARGLPDPISPDVVKIEAFVLGSASAPRAGVFTLSRDFDLGTMTGVEGRTTADQLQLAKEKVTLPFIWVPNSDQGTVSKVDTRTGRELGRYRTCPDGIGDPSRTTVDQEGNCWVGNRYSGTVVKIGLLENGSYIDRNGNGRADTSRDANHDGDIDDDELLPWGEDECVLFEVVLIKDEEGTYTPGAYKGAYAEDFHNPGPRGIGVDSKGDVWVGTYDTMKYYHLDGETGRILRSNSYEAIEHTAYGAVLDAQGILWSSGVDKQHVLRLDTTSNSSQIIPIGHYVYGLGLDSHGHLYVSGWADGKLTRLNVTNSEIEWSVAIPEGGRGVAVTPDDDIWVAISDQSQVIRVNTNGEVKAVIAVDEIPTGVAVDAAGKVWVVNNGSDTIQRIDPAVNRVDLTKHILNTRHYGYSDMTGYLSRTVTTRLGSWVARHDAGVTNTRWGVVSWHADAGGSNGLRVRVRSSNDQQLWSGWEVATNEVVLRSTPAGRYVELSVDFQGDANGGSPVLYDIAIYPASVPSLNIALGPNGNVVVAWPQTPGCQLETTGQLRAGATWTPVAEPILNNSGMSYVTVTALGTNRFFRLKQ